MKISKLAIATLVPATVAGVVATAVPFAQAAPAAPAAHAAPRRAYRRSRCAPRHPGQGQAAPCGPPQGASRAAPHRARPQTSNVSQPLTAGMSSFEQCVAWRESGDNPTASSAGLFGILPSTWAQLGYSGTAGQASVALQKVAFTRLYAQYGAQPWAPSDGC